MPHKPSHNQVRIIGGRHRGRRLAFPDAEGLRPTGDRIRETLFNWLAPYIHGAKCLDAFAGSGALGFEAASRGASRVLMLEQSAAVAKQLQANADLLQLENVQVRRKDAMAMLGQPADETFDIVFLDPPFSDSLLDDCFGLLAMNGWLKERAFVYLEFPAGLEPVLPSGWEFFRIKSAGQVGYGLANRA